MKQYLNLKRTGVELMIAVFAIITQVAVATLCLNSQDPSSLYPTCQDKTFAN